MPSKWLGSSRAKVHSRGSTGVGNCKLQEYLVKTVVVCCSLTLGESFCRIADRRYLEWRHLVRVNAKSIRQRLFSDEHKPTTSTWNLFPSPLLLSYLLSSPLIHLTRKIVKWQPWCSFTISYGVLVYSLPLLISMFSYQQRLLAGGHDDNSRYQYH